MKTYNKNPEAVSLLSPEQYRVTQQDGTERPFQNEYWNNKEPGLYVDVVSGEPLFASVDKFDSGTGWPSFWQPIDPKVVETTTDYKLIFPRNEVHCARCEGHQGHIFKDGPKPTGLRYCINGVALKFVAA
jgi:peptide-methionine (R)-S-oxide reductase